MKKALARHDELLREIITEDKGRVFKTVGDAFCAAFSSPDAALQAALRIQQAVREEKWGLPFPLQVRIALNTGEAEERDRDYFGPALNRVARLLAVTRGGHTLVASSTRELVFHSLPDKIQLRDLGEHHLRDLNEPEQIFQLLHPDLPSDFPLINAYSLTANNLPVQVTQFIGRENEMEEIKKILSSCRLATLTGTGGLGKTRLSLETAKQLIGIYKDGVWFVELSALANPDLIPQEIAVSIGLKEETGMPVLKTLTNFLRDKHVLLILDNCEHLIDPCAKIVVELLKNSGSLRILSTSRQPLGISGEAVFRVLSLPFPDPTRSFSLSELFQYPAIRLFENRAALVKRDFKLSSQNAGFVMQICKQLDGIPLAIELAAARVKVLSVEQIVPRLQERFRLLTSGSRTALDRHQTLQAAIDWSHEFLPPEEREAFRRLSVFSGDFSLEAAETVCAREGTGSDEILNLISELADKSLLIVEDKRGEVYYHFLETIREYALKKLKDAEEETTFRKRHCDYYLTLAEKAEPEITGSDAIRWFSRLENELDNFRSALSWCKQEADGEKQLRIAGALWQFYFRGLVQEGRTLLEEALENEKGSSPSVLAKAFLGAGTFAWQQNDYERAEFYSQKSLALSREVGNKSLAAWSLNILASISNFTSEYRQAKILFQESLSLFQEVHDIFGVALSLIDLGMVALFEAEYAEGIRYLTQALEMARQIKHDWTISFSLRTTGEILRCLGDTRKARETLEEALDLKKKFGEKTMIARNLASLALVTLDEKNFEMAGEIIEEGLIYAKETGSTWDIANFFYCSGRLYLNLEKAKEAVEYYEQSLQMREKLKDRRGIAETLEGLAKALCVLGEHTRAVSCLSKAEKLRAAIHAPIPPVDVPGYESNLADLRRILGEDVFSSTWTMTGKSS